MVSIGAQPERTVDFVSKVSQMWIGSFYHTG